MNTETKVGIFFVVGFVALFLATLWVEDFRILKQTYTLQARFDTIAGLPEKAVVAVGGVKAGRVADRRIENDKVVLSLRLDSGVPVRADSVAVLSADTIVGTRYVNISLGTPGSPVLQDGDEVRTKELLRLEDLAEAVGDLVDSGKELFGNLNTAQENVVGRITSLLDQNAGKVAEILDQFGEVSRNANQAIQIVQRIASSVESGTGTLGRLIQDDTLYNNANRMSENIAYLTNQLREGEGFLAQLFRDEKLYGKIDGIATALYDVAQAVRSSTGTLGKLLNDPEMYDQFSRVAENLVAFSDQLNQFMNANRDNLANTMTALSNMAPQVQATLADLGEIMAKVKSGEGTLGKLVNDSALYDEANRTLREVRRAIESMQEQAPLTTFTSVIGGGLR